MSGIRIGGHIIRIHDTGAEDGSVFVLLHGIGLSHRPYEKLAARLARFGRVIVLDLPGFGANRKPSATLTVEECARVVGATIEHLGVTAAVLVGHSMGAQFALEFALQRPELVTHLVMIGPVVDPRRASAWQQGLALARDSMLEPITTNFVVFTDYLRCGPRWYLRELRPMLNYPTLEKARELALPLLTIRGARDPIARASWCRMLSAAAGSGAHMTVPRKRHVVIHTAPDAVAHAIVRFALRPSSITR